MSDVIDDPLLARAEEFLTTAEDYADAMSAAESVVRRWAWFTDIWCCSPEPFGAQRNGFPPGRELPGEPDFSSGVSRCGFDQHDRAVASDWYHVGGQNLVHTVRFFENDACTELVVERGTLLAVTFYQYKEDVLVRQATISQTGSVVSSRHLSEYSYDNDGRLGRVHRRSWDDRYPAETQRRMAAGAIEAFEYDDAGNLLCITAWSDLPGCSHEVIYKRRTKTSTAKKEKTRLATQLAISIEDAVKQSAVHEKVWCLALHYDRESALPPDVVIGVERERREWGAAVDLLNPAEWDAKEPPRRLRLVYPGLLDAFAEAWDALFDDDGAPLGAVLNEAAKRLNRGRLRDHLDVTEDFFVYAVDLELEDVDANLRAALGKDRYRKLRDAGLTSG